jgi:RNA polymerase sigma-70 factor (ECF subfamily)
LNGPDRDRNRKLFELFVRENEGALVTYLRSLVRDPGLVDDLFQETLITAWRRFDDFDTSRPLAPWLRGIALNLVRNARRKRAGDLMLVGDEVAVFIDQAIAKVETIEADHWADRIVVLKHCIDRLTARSRSLVKWRYSDNNNATEIAERLNESPFAVRKQLQRIRETLLECIEHRLREASS